MCAGRSRGALSAVRRSLHPKPVRGEAEGVVTSPPHEAPRPHRGAARGAAEGPCDSSRGWQAFPCRGLLRCAAECAAKGGFARVGDRRGVKTAGCGPCAGFDGLTWIRT